LIILVFLFLVSCKKKPETLYISGVVRQNNTETVSDAKVKLYTQQIVNNTWSAAYSVLESTSSDDNGNFQFLIEDFAYVNFKIEVSKENHYAEFIEFTKNNFSGNKYFNEFNIYPFGCLQIHIKNSAPVNTQDYMSYQLLGDMPSTFQAGSDSIFYFNGNSVDTTKTCKVYGNYNILINWSTFKSNILKEYSDTIYIFANDTTCYDLFY